MRTRMMSLSRFFCCLLLVVIVGMANGNAEAEPMARPTRPKAFADREDLRRYLDLVREYYSWNGKARYGKRSDITPMSETNATLEVLKMILDAQRQNQQRRQEKFGQSKEQILYRDFHSSDAGNHASRVATRPGYLLDVIGRYYDDVQ